MSFFSRLLGFCPTFLKATQISRIISKVFHYFYDSMSIYESESKSCAVHKVSYPHSDGLQTTHPPDQLCQIFPVFFHSIGDKPVGRACGEKVTDN